MNGVNKWFGGFHALRDIDLEIGAGERVVVCGPSGSGKSTMIRCVNRLERHARGRIVVDGIELNDRSDGLRQIRAEVGMVFQSFNLFPHMTVLENLTLGPMRVRKQSAAEARETAMHYLERVPHPGAGRQTSFAAFRRAAAAGGHRTGALHETPR